MDGPLTDETGMIAGTVADVAAPAEWAMKAAEAAFDNPLHTDSMIQSVARAIEAADKAATERERKRLEEWCRDAMSDVLGCIDLNLEEERGAIIWLQNVRAAIRKGGTND